MWAKSPILKRRYFCLFLAKSKSDVMATEINPSWTFLTGSIQPVPLKGLRTHCWFPALNPITYRRQAATIWIPLTDVRPGSIPFRVYLNNFRAKRSRVRWNTENECRLEPPQNVECFHRSSYLGLPRDILKKLELNKIAEILGKRRPLCDTRIYE